MGLYSIQSGAYLRKLHKGEIEVTRPKKHNLGRFR